MRKKKYILAILMLLIILVCVWYYKYVGFEKLDEYSMQLYSMSRQEWSEQTLIKDDIDLYNAQTFDAELKNYFQVRKYAQNIADRFYDGCHYEKPFIIKFIKDKNAWIVQGSNDYLANHDMLGGVMYLVLDKSNGDILYISHTL